MTVLLVLLTFIFFLAIDAVRTYHVRIKLPKLIPKDAILHSNGMVTMADGGERIKKQQDSQSSSV